jgi:hypothetical protein
MTLKSHLGWTSAHARGVLGLLFILTALATPALADRDGKRHKHHKHGDGGPPIGVPEIDPGSMLGGLTLLVGGTFILADRRCRSKPRVGLN